MQAIYKYLGWRETQLTSMNSGMNFWPCGVYGKVASKTVSMGLPSVKLSEYAAVVIEYIDSKQSSVDLQLCRRLPMAESEQSAVCDWNTTSNRLSK